MIVPDDNVSLSKYEAHMAALDAELTPEVLAEGERLYAEGWRQVSRKYRRITHVAFGGDALAALDACDPERAALVRADAAKYAQDRAIEWLWLVAPTQDLSAARFEAFRRAAARGGAL